MIKQIGTIILTTVILNRELSRYEEDTDSAEEEAWWHKTEPPEPTKHRRMIYCSHIMNFSYCLISIVSWKGSCFLQTLA